MSPARGLEKATIRQLGSWGWLAEHVDVLLSGPTVVAVDEDGVRTCGNGM